MLNWRLDYYSQSIYQPTYNGNYKRDNIRSADSYQIISKYSRKVITYLFVRTPAWLWRTPSWTPTPRWPRRGAPRRRGAGQLRPPSRSRSRRRAWRSAVASTRLAQSLSHHLDLILTLLLLQGTEQSWVWGLPPLSGTWLWQDTAEVHCDMRYRHDNDSDQCDHGNDSDHHSSWGYPHPWLTMISLVV